MLAYLVVWVAIVVLTVVLMAHRGHSWFSWAILTGALGPLAWPLALREVVADRRTTRQPPSTVGDVLIALVPRAGSADPILGAVRQVDPPVRSATLVAVLDAEDAATPAGRAAAADAEALLARSCRMLKSAGLVSGQVEHRVLYGRPADEIARLAASGSFRAIVLGPCGPRRHHLLHGCTRARLERRTSVPLKPTREAEVSA